MRIIGINAAVTTVEDIISAGGTLTPPTQDRIHAIVSASAEDDVDGILQVETATVTGTITNPGDLEVVITSAIMAGSPLTLAVPVVNGVNTVSAEAIRQFLNNDASAAPVRLHYAISGATDKVILTAKVKAANDATLNIALATGTATGLTTAATSANTTAGVVGSGAWTVQITGISSGRSTSEVVALQGITPVNTVNAYSFINEMKVLTAGSGGYNAGAITATAATDSSVTCTMAASSNFVKQAFFMADSKSEVLNLYLSAINATANAITTFTIYKKPLGGAWIPIRVVELSSTEQSKSFPGLFEQLVSNDLFKVSATVSAGSSSCVATFDAYN